MTLIVAGVMMNACSSGDDSGTPSDAGESRGSDAGSKSDATQGFGSDAGAFGGSDAGHAQDAAGDAENDSSSSADAADAGEVKDASTAVDASSAEDSGDASTGAGSLLISQVQTRGSNGGNDEFIELYNPSSVSVTFDSTWTITHRSAVGTCSSDTSAVIYTGANQVIDSHKHLLLTGADYSGSTASDATLGTGTPDAASIVLVHASTTVDALCFYYDATTHSSLTTCSTPYVCEGTPVANPHDNSTSTDTNQSVERKPGGSSGNATDTNDNASDFATSTPSDPHDLSSAAVP